RMNHSASFCAAGSVSFFSASVASMVLPWRARSKASLSTARSPVSSGFASAVSPLFFFLWCFAATRTERLVFSSFFEAALLTSFFGAALAEGSAFRSCFFSLWDALWVAAQASLDGEARAAKTNRQGNGRNNGLIPWSLLSPPAQKRFIQSDP